MAKIQNTDESVKQQELLFASDGNVKWYSYFGFPGEGSGKDPTCQCRRHKRRGFDPWIGKILWRRKWQTVSVFLPGESPQTEEPGGPRLQSDTTEASLHARRNSLGENL